MPIRVPANPNTTRRAQLPYAQATGGTGAQAVLSGAAQFADSLRRYNERRIAEQDKLDEFDLTLKANNELLRLNTDLTARKQEADANAPQFTERWLADTEAAHQQILQEAEAAGYSENARQALAVRLSAHRTTFGNQALEWQMEHQRSYGLGQVTAAMDGLTRLATDDPLNLDAALEEATRLINLRPELSEADKQSQIAKARDALIPLAGIAYAEKFPQQVVEKLAPHLLPKPQRTYTMTADGDFDLGSYIAKMDPVEGRGKNPNSSATGFGQFLENTWAGPEGGTGYYQKVFGNTGETRAEILAKRGDPVVARQVAERFTRDNVEALKAEGLGVNNASVYLSHFLGSAGAIKVLKAGLDTPIGEVVSADAIASNRTVFRSVKTVEDMVKWAAEKMGMQTDEHGVVQVDEADYQRRMAEWESKQGASGPTGIPALDLLDGAQKLQVSRQAAMILDRQAQQAEQEAAKAARAQELAERETHQARLNALYVGLNDGSKTAADIQKAREDGWLTDFDEINKAEGIVASLAKNNADEAVFAQMYNNPGSYNPYDKASVDAVEAGTARAFRIEPNASMARRLGTVLNIWEKTGILSKQGGTMLRGALVSADPATVATAAHVASSMIAVNPNAFAGVQGAEQIQTAATVYANAVDNLGLNPTEAAARVQKLNSPEARKPAGLNDPGRQELVTRLGKVDVSSVLNDVLTPDRGIVAKVMDPFGLVTGESDKTFTSPTQLAEASTTYRTIALDHYDQFHDAEAAMVYARDQMTRFYGVVEGQLMKYPPTKAYPAIAGSHRYVFDQARERVVAHLGSDKDLDSVWLQPLPRLTANAFRAGKPVPYQIFYTTTFNGQKVIGTVPNLQFTADPAKGRTDMVTRDRRRQELLDEGYQRNLETRGY